MSRTGKSRQKVHQWLPRVGEVGEAGAGADDKNVLQLALVTALKSMDILNTTEQNVLHGWITRLMNYSSIKLIRIFKK